MFRPNKAAQMTTPLRLLIPVSTASYGVRTKTFEAAEGLIMANFSTFGGTEVEQNGVTVVEDTAEVTCWYRPDITSGCRVQLLVSGNDALNPVYEVIGTPENIEMRNQFLLFKVRRVRGGA